MTTKTSISCLSHMWSRRLSSRMGIHQSDFEEAFLKALNSPPIMQGLKISICGDLQQEIQSLNATIDRLQGLLAVKDGVITRLEEKVTVLESTIDDHEQYSRRNSLRLSGLARIPDEDPIDTTIKILNEAMNLDPPLTSGDLDRAHRVGAPASPDRAMLIKFATYRARRRVMEAKSISTEEICLVSKMGSSLGARSLSPRRSH